ncbi:hypothetical protein [Thermodesulfatator indicus]
MVDKELGERLTKKDFEVFERRFEAFAERTEENFRKVWQAINKLAEAQKRSEERLTKLEITVQELAEAQKETEKKLNELAEAQKETEKTLQGH